MHQTPRRSVVLGACGFLGTHLVEVLALAGHELLALDEASRVAGEDPHEVRSGAGSPGFPEVLRGLGVEPQVWPLSWREALAGADFLFVVEGPEAQVREALAGVDPNRLQRVVLVSGAEVYGDSGAEPFSEDAAPAPQGGRARELLDLEQALRGSDLPHAVLRPAGAYGPRGPRCLREARRRLTVTGGRAEERLSLVHARDIARAALHLAARAGSAQATTYNLGDEVGLSTSEATRLVTRLAGRPHLRLPWAAPRALPWRSPLKALPLALRRRLAAGLLSSPRSLSSGAQWVSSKRLIRTGFALDYPHPAHGLRETLAWFKQEGWL